MKVQGRVEQTMRLVAYVDLSLTEVIERFASPEIDDILGRSLRAAAGEDDERTTVRASRPQRLSGRCARVRLPWRAVDRTGRTREGTASLQLLVVQTGACPKTELIVTVTMADGVDRAAARTTTRFLDELTDRLPALAG